MGICNFYFDISILSTALYASSLSHFLFIGCLHSRQFGMSVTNGSVSLGVSCRHFALVLHNVVYGFSENDPARTGENLAATVRPEARRHGSRLTPNTVRETLQFAKDIDAS